MEETAGKKLLVEINWENIINDDNTIYLEDSFDDIFVKPSVAAFKQVCRDEMDKKAFSAGGKEIVIDSNPTIGLN